MYFKQILNERCGCASYLIASRQSHEAAIVDPSTDLEQYEALLALKAFAGPHGMNIRQLSERLQVKHHTAVSLVDKLERARFGTERPRLCGSGGGHQRVCGGTEMEW